MPPAEMPVRRFRVAVDDRAFPGEIEAVCVEVGEDLVVVVGGGSRYHCGAVALSISIPSLKDPHKLTNSTYQAPVPGHKEEALAREGSLLLSKALRKNVVMSVGIHVDDLPKDKIAVYTDHFYALIDQVARAFHNPQP